MTLRSGVWLAAVILAVACARKTPPEEIAPVREKDAATQPPRPLARTWPSNVPSATAGCKTHDDCAVLMDAPQNDPCCFVRVLQPVTRAYADFVQRYRADNCTGAVCPTEPLPGPEPACCASIGRCSAGKCVSGCEDPTLQAPAVPWIDSLCRMPRP